MKASEQSRIVVAAAFLSAACCYWLCVFPRVQREVRHWRRRAEEISDPALRTLALQTHRAKWGNVEGAAAFATFVPRSRRALVIRALVAFQAAYDYADTVSEQPSPDITANGLQLHSALLVALEPGASHRDYYAYNSSPEPSGYLESLIDTCQAALAELPSYEVVARPARRAAMRIVTYQGLNHSEDLTQEGLARWALTETPPGTDLRWWETSAAGASSLAVLALIAAAAEPGLQVEGAAAIGGAYFPWIGALHTLLDSLIDHREDTEAGQPSLLDNYSSPTEVAVRMEMLAEQSLARATRLPSGRQHALLLAGMSSLYLSAEEASSDAARPATERVLKVLGELAKPTMAVMVARRLVGRLAHLWAHERLVRLRRFGRLASVRRRQP